MTVLKRGNSRFWYIQFQRNGRTYIKSSRTTDKRVAEQMEREWRSELHAQQFLGQKERITIREAIQAHIDTKRDTPNHTNLTLQERVLERLFRATPHMDEITPEDLERLKRDRTREGVGPATVKQTFTLIRGAWKHARKMGYHTVDLHFPTIRLPKHHFRCLSVEEERRLLAELNPRRETLLAAEAKSVSVSDVAIECGFAHWGRFAHGYKHLFGESPSTTLKRRARPAPNRLADFLPERSLR